MDRPNHGKFFGKVVTEWLDDAGNGRNMRLLEPFSYCDPKGRMWLAQVGAIINGASIPRFFWRIIGSPYTGSYRRASVLHDVACDQRMAPAPAVHRMFYYACRCGGIRPFKAWIMWAAVRFFGPSWK